MWDNTFAVGNVVLHHFKICSLNPVDGVLCHFKIHVHLFNKHMIWWNNIFYIYINLNSRILRSSAIDVENCMLLDSGLALIASRECVNIFFHKIVFLCINRFNYSTFKKIIMLLFFYGDSFFNTWKRSQ